MKKFLLLGMLGLFALTGASASAQLINGAGSSFDYPAFTLWFDAYAKIAPGVRFNYQSIGSGAGQRQLLARTVAFGASDAPMSDAAMAGASGKILHIPIVAGAVAITYNLPGAPVLRFDADTLASIYLGDITQWNDAKIATLNPGVALPARPIIVVHRSDGSGTSFIFTDYLSNVSVEWKSRVGTNTAVKWPVGLGGKGNEGVAGQVKQLPGAIGYVELSYAKQNRLPAALLQNAAGEFIAPSPDAVSKAMATTTVPGDFRFSMVNAPGAGAYPIAGASWVLIYQKSGEPAKEMVKFLRWAVTEGQRLSPSLNYAPLPENVQQRVVQLLDTVTE